MELGTLFTEQRWNILSALSKGDYSPMQLAEKSNTTMANISQQLKLLEMSNLVKKEKIQNRDKGKPRSIFSLCADKAYIISSMKGFAQKKLIILDKLHKILFRTWFIDDLELRYYLNKFIWTLEKSVDDISFIGIIPSESEIKTVIGIDNHKHSDKKIDKVVIKNAQDGSKEFRVEKLSQEDVKKMADSKKGIFSEDDIIVIYDQNMIVENLLSKGDTLE